MTVTRLHPVTLPVPEISDADRISAVLRSATEVHETDTKAGEGATSAIVIFYREEDDGFSASWVTQGLSKLELVGLLTTVAGDIRAAGAGVVEEQDAPA